MLRFLQVLLATQLSAESPAPAAPDSSQAPPVETMIEALHRGHLVIDQARFKPSEDQLIDGIEPVLRQTARALSHSEGRYLVFVPIERDRHLPPDTVLSRRRSLTALHRLLAAGSNPNRLLESPDRLQQRWTRFEPVAPGKARIELVRVE